jgi:multicomponent Na+:H+ antiporter subunit D
MIGEVSPGLLMIVGAALVPFLKGPVRAAWMLALPVIAFAQLLSLPYGDLGQASVAGLHLTTLRIDRLSSIFAYIFLIATFLGVLYNLYHDDRVQHTAGLVYAGSAVGAVLAGDLVTLFLYWEGTAIASVFLIWAVGSERAFHAGMRYLVVQIGSGVLLLSGVMLHAHATGSIAFTHIGLGSTASWLILLAFGIKCAFPLLNGWLADAYPEATPGGTVLLSAFTTKLAVYALARGYAGVELLIPIGLVMAIVPLVQAAAETDLRRALAYTLNNQLGFMVVGVGIGTELALSGTAAQAVSHIVYKSLLFMALGAVLFRTGTAQALQLGGLYRSMPLTAAFGAVGAASIALPFLCGFVSKSLILSAAMKGGYLWSWLILVAAGAGAFLVTGLKVPIAAFLGPDRGRRPEEAPWPMLAAMGLTAVLAVGIGIMPGLLYQLLPFKVSYDVYTLEHVVTQLQLVAFSALAFVLLARWGWLGADRPAVLLDSDWLYRRAGFRLAGAIERGATTLWEGIAGAAVAFAFWVKDLAKTHHGPTGVFGRDWPTGTMAFWTTLLLGAYLILSYI